MSLDLIVLSLLALGAVLFTSGTRTFLYDFSPRGAASTSHADGVAIYVVGDDARVSDNYAVVMNNTASAGAYVAGLALNAARCLATGNNVNGIGVGGATLCGILFGNGSVGSCVAVGNHMNGKGVVDLAGGNYCEVTHGNRA